MPSRKIRAFLGTDVLLEYIRGKEELQSLFSDEVREHAAFAINAIVLQELLLSDGVDLTRIVPYLEVIGTGVDRESPGAVAELTQPRNGLMHVNDLFILASARSCDVLLTYDRDLLNAAPAVAVRSETPEEFLEELGTAA